MTNPVGFEGYIPSPLLFVQTAQEYIHLMVLLTFSTILAFKANSALAFVDLSRHLTYPCCNGISTPPLCKTGRSKSNPRCYTFTGPYLESLPAGEPFDCATSLLVSQFLLDPRERADFFRSIAGRLKPGGILATSDLASDREAPHYSSLLEVWLRTMTTVDLSAERVQQMRAAYDRDVAILPIRSVEAIIASGGFEPPVQFYQAGLIHAWYCRRQ